MRSKIKRYFRGVYNAIIGRAAGQTVPGMYLDIERSDLDLILKFSPYTMTSIERRFNLLNTIRYIHKNKLEGAIVECGVWKGGNMMLVADALINLGDKNRDIYLFDTFAGMPPPTDIDVDQNNISAKDRMICEQDAKNSSYVWALAGLDEVRANFAHNSYPKDKIFFIEGLVEETIPKKAPEQIAVARLDTDWYQSTKHELAELYPRVVSGGVVIIDDYGYWRGARQATDEFLDSIGHKVLLHRIDDTCRAFVKP